MYLCFSLKAGCAINMRSKAAQVCHSQMERIIRQTKRRPKSVMTCRNMSRKLHLRSARVVRPGWRSEVAS